MKHHIKNMVEQGFKTFGHYNKFNIWFVSDTHFQHENILKMNRPTFKNIHEHDEHIINTIKNEVDVKNDIIFHLGDFSFGNVTRAEEILDELGANIILIKGNHDQVALKLKERFLAVYDYKEINYIISDNPKKRVSICLFHYPILSWNRQHHNSIHLHGHSHGSVNHLNVGIKRFDVGIVTGAEPNICYSIDHILKMFGDI